MNISLKNIIKGLLLVIVVSTIAPALKAQSPDLTGYKVMLNPGHGGHDSDDRGMPNGFWESESNLTKGIELRDILEERGAEVVMSRVTNFTHDDLPLSQIAAMANENEVDLMISIHSNAGNQVTNYPMPIFNGHTNSPANPDAKVFAEILWEQLITIESTYWTNTDPHAIGDLTLNPSWSYGYGVLYPLTVPGIISEGSFHDYQPEVGRLLSLDYRKQEAWNMYYAMIDYFEIDEQEPFGHISGLVRDSLLEKENYSIVGSPDKYEVVKSATVELLETGEVYHVGDTSKAQWFFKDDPDKEVNFNAGFYYFDSLPQGTYTLVFSGEKYFNDTVFIEVTPHKFNYYNQWMEADKTMAPELLASNPNNGDTINCFDPLQFTFDMNMDSISFAGAFQVSPTVSGSFEWDDKYLNVWFQPDLPYETNKKYDVIIDSTAEHQWGVSLDSIINLSFVTGDRNRYNVDFTFPEANQDEVSPYLQFRVIFDAPIKNTSVINAVSIIAEDGTVIGTKGANINTVDGKGHYYFEAEEDLQFDANYTLRLEGSIQDELGIPLVDPVEIPFSTMPALGNLTGLNSFDEVAPFSMDYANSVGIDAASFLYRWGSDKMEGTASLLMRYNFLDDSDGKIILNTSEPFALNAEANELGMWIWGDLSLNDLYFVYSNEYSELFTTIDFAGWKYISKPLNSQTDTLRQMVYYQTTAGKLGGDIFFDFLSQPEVISVWNNPLNNVDIYPNPLVGEQVYISGLKSDSKAEYQIFNQLGKLLKSGKVNNNRIEINQKIDSKVLIINIIQDNSSCRFLLINHQ